MQFQLVQYLQDVLPSFAKKLIVLMDVKEIQSTTIGLLNDIFQSNKGENSVTFEIMELEKHKRLAVVEKTIEDNEISDEEISIETEAEIENTEEPVVAMTEEVEEIRVVTKLSMPSRKLKVKISNELLTELEKLQINFKLN